jgi:2-iminobutanoate/2-iminopropanoate deaminase
MPVTPVPTPHAPPAVGPYSAAVRAGDWVVCSGQIGLDPQSGDLVAGGVEAETRQVLAHIAAIVGDAGASVRDVARSTVYLTDLANFAAMNAIYEDFFGDHRPARTTIAVSGLPKGALVEIEVLVHRPVGS